MKNLFKYLKTLLTIIILIFFIQYFLNNQQDLHTVLSTPLDKLIYIFILFSLMILFDGVFLKIILRDFKKTISNLESQYITIVSYIGNYFLPLRGGAVIRSVYLKKKFNFSYSNFVSTLYGYYIIVFLVNSFVALTSLIFLQRRYNIISIPLYIFFGVTFVTMLTLSIFKLPFHKLKIQKQSIIKKMLDIVKNILNGWNVIVSNKKLLISLTILSLLRFFASALLFYVQFKALEIEVSLLNVLIYNCLSGVSLLVSLTPGSLGVREAIFVITSDVLGITNDQVMQLALLDRGMVVITLLILFVAIYILSKIFKKQFVDEKIS